MTITAFLVSKILVATAVASAAELARRRSTWPELAYALWVSVLAVLLIPSVISISMPASLTAGLAGCASNCLTALGLAVQPGNHQSTRGILPLDTMTGPALQFLILGWLCGGGVVLLRQTRGLQLLERLVRFATPVRADLSKRCADLAAEQGIRRRPHVVTAAGGVSPFLWYPFWGSARIVIPAELSKRLSANSLDAVLLHELIHLRRHDAWRRRIETVVSALLWWLPITWIARSRLRELEELCTDAAVLRWEPSMAKSYAGALLDTEEYLADFNPYGMSGVSAFARRGSLQARISRIVGNTPNSVSAKSRPLLCTAVLMSLTLGLLTARSGPDEFVDRQGAALQTANTFDPAIESKIRARPASVASNAAGRRSDASPSSSQESGSFPSPDFDSVTVHNSDREIVLTWNEVGTTGSRSIRLIRISSKGVEPILWRIDGPLHNKKANPVKRRELEWMLAFLGSKNEIVDSDGRRYRHPRLAARDSTSSRTLAHGAWGHKVCAIPAG